MVRGDLYRECVRRLEDASVPDSSFDAMCIFEDMLGEKMPMLFAEKEVSPETEKRIRSLTERRCGGEPLQYILGSWEFWGLPVKVGEGVLIPRPDTETLVEQVLSICRKNGLKAPKIADLCSGSGCIALALKAELPDADISAVEFSDAAWRYLNENIALNAADIKAVRGDVLDPETVSLFSGLDIIVSNPPYLTETEMNDLQREVAMEPEYALYGGSDGLDYYRKMTELWRAPLKNGGWLCYEFGMGQHDAVGEILEKNNFYDIEFARDGGRIIRTVTARKSEV